MESETPPPPPTLSETRVSQLTPASIHAAWADDDPPAYLTAHSANSGRLHNNFIRGLSLHMQAFGSRVVMRGLNDFRTYDRHKLTLAMHRPPTQALLTLSNHQSTLDDPAVLSTLTPYSAHTSVSGARWSWCAREMCFRTPLSSWLMRHGKIVPIVRGLGLYQTGFREAEDHLRAGQWMHVFPEGKCIPISRGIAALKWGSAKLIVDAIRRNRACGEAKRMYAESMEAMNEETQRAAAASTHHSTAAALSTPAVAAAPSGSAAAAADSSISPFARPPPVVPGASFASALRTALLHPSFAASSSAAAASAAHASRPCPDPPLVIPMVHHGMPRVMPFYHIVPRIGKTVRVIVGDAIDVQSMVRLHDSAGNAENRSLFQWPLEEDLLISVTQRIAKEMRALDEKLCEIEEQEGQPQPRLPERPYGRGIGPEHQ